MPKSSRQGQSKNSKNQGLSNRTRSHDKIKKPQRTRSIIQSYTSTGLALPKRPRNALIIYSAEKRQKVANQNPDANGQEITRILGRQFNKLPEEKRKRYDDLSEKESKRYRKEKKLLARGVTRVPVDGPFEKEVARYHKKHPEEFGQEEHDDDDSDDDNDHDHDNDDDDNNDSDDDNNDSDDDDDSDDSSDDDDDDHDRRRRGRQQSSGRSKSSSRGQSSSSRKGQGYHGDHDAGYDGRRNNPGRPRKNSSRSSGGSGKKQSSKKGSGDFGSRVHADSNRYLKKNKDYLPKYLDTDSD